LTFVEKSQRDKYGTLISILIHRLWVTCLYIHGFNLLEELFNLDLGL